MGTLPRYALAGSAALARSAPLVLALHLGCDERGQGGGSDAAGADGMADSGEEDVPAIDSGSGDAPDAGDRDEVGDGAQVDSDLSGDGAEAGDPIDDEFTFGPPLPPCSPLESPGTYVAGVTTLELEDRLVEVWYPATPGAETGRERDAYDMRDWLPADAAALIPDDDVPLFVSDAYRDVPAAEGAFPVVLFSHGFGGYRMQSTFLMTHLASWGFVVAAPDHLERGLAAVVENPFSFESNDVEDLRHTLALLLEQNTRAAGLLEGRINPELIAVTGHSAGGGAATSVAFDEGIDALVTFASGGMFGGGDMPAIPTLMMAGETDAIAQMSAIEAAWEEVAPPRWYVALHDAGHLAFSDICYIGREDGGVLAIAADHGVAVPGILRTLGADGCAPSDLLAEDGWGPIRHFTLAVLLRAFETESAPDGLSEESISCFGDRILSYRHDP